MNKNTLVVGFMLFAIFFGAGNLIFPPKLGLESGTAFLPAISGFVLTGIGLPLLGIVVSAFYEGGYKAALNKISPYFSIAFLVAIYLAIGPFFAGPRTGATAYEMAVVPFLGQPDSLSLFLFSSGYFAVALWLSLNPSKMVDRIGSILTPVLILSILALVVQAYFLLSGNEPLPNPTEKAYFASGMLEGYQTMDALAALAFSVIVINAIKAKGVPPSALAKQTALAGVVAAVALAIIYTSLGWIGNHLPISAETLADLAAKNQDVGTYILNSVTAQAFGELGRTLLGIIVSLACLTTTVGLAVSVSEYFHELLPKISYRAFVILFVLISFAIANQGLTAVISKSIPMLLILYPIAMTVMLMLALNILVKIPLVAQRLTLAIVSLISILSVLGVGFTEALPLKNYSMEWLPFAVGGVVFGSIFAKLSARK
ncbi:branched-chain amino acid transport system II carrier protein [Haemophilus paracuniculus]|uniref:Branched-chain amino acid transport system carrier protein n=1 Tax=Haemophilus paracuniculus TaxID=734 RepID=A0A1T0AUC1_9PAST|nr:branched-chain amino acid transport system II carrier protein [Haemophilus paracuniculus]OOS00186.1 branched-chain amino acid transport system II carrier protein [Haemophilus paracuniculus]